MSVQYLQEHTQIKLEILIQILGILLKVKVLLTDSPDWKSSQKLTTDSVLKLNQNYNNKKNKININVPIKSETKEDDDHTHRRIDESRKYVIEVWLLLLLLCPILLIYEYIVSEGRYRSDYEDPKVTETSGTDWSGARPDRR